MMHKLRATTITVPPTLHKSPPLAVSLLRCPPPAKRSTPTTTKTTNMKQNRSDDATAPDPVLLQAATSAVVTSVAALSQLVLFGLNNTRVVRDARHKKLVDLVRDR